MEGEGGMLEKIDSQYGYVRKVLSCLVVFAIVISVVPWAVVAHDVSHSIAESKHIQEQAAAKEFRSQVYSIEQTASSTYHPQAAYNYAKKYWDEVCSDGYFWNSSSTYIPLPLGTNIVGRTGYDCAHFVSCCIGSEPNEKGGGLDVPSRVPPTYGEPGAAKLGDWLINSGKGVEKTSIDELEMGDVINYDWNGDGHWDYIALYLGNGKVAAHTKCVWNEDWKLGGAKNYRFIHIKRNTIAVVGSSTFRLL